MDSEGSVIHYLKFQVTEPQRFCLVFAIINSAHSKTVHSLSREAVSASAVEAVEHSYNIKIFMS